MNSDDDCECHRCIRERRLGMEWEGYLFPLNRVKMILCKICGNKRCPHASDHDLQCTGSNEHGQAGSVYPGYSFRSVKNEIE